MRLLLALWASGLIAQDTVALAAVIYSGILLMTLSWVRIALLECNSMYCLTVVIFPIWLIRIFLLGGGILDIASCAPPVILGFQDP